MIQRKQSLIMACKALKRCPDIDNSKMPAYNLVRKIRRNGINIFRTSKGRYFLELYWLKKIETKFNVS